MHTHFTRIAGSLAVFVCVACDDAGPERDIKPAESPDDGVDASTAGSSLATMWLDQPMFRSGSRLRARVLDGDGDAVVFVGFRDLDLARDCEFALAGDGERRCLPVARDGSIYYLDPACTQPAFRQSAAGECKAAVGPYALQTTVSECARDQRTRVYGVGAQRADSFGYAAIGGECQALGMLDCLHDAAELEPTQFARGEIQSEPTGAGVAIDWIESEDGARSIASLRDTARDLECSVQPELRPEVCLPVPAAQVVGGMLEGIGDLFSGEACSAPMAALDVGAACAPPAIALLRQKTVCGTFALVPYELGPSVGAGSARSSSGCSAFTPKQGQTLYSTGDPLDASMRPALRLARGGTDRLAVRYYATADGIPVQYDSVRFFDRDLSSACEPQSMADATLRCVPGGATVATDPAGPFLDAECTQLLVAVPLADRVNGCGLMPEYARRLDPATTMLAGVHNLNPPLRTAPADVYFLVDGACTARKAKPSVEYQRLGPAVELAVVHERLF